MLSETRMNQIMQTVIERSKKRTMGPPDSYTAEEKDYYTEIEKEIVELREQGFKGTFSIPTSYD